MGECYLNGKGVAKNEGEAIRLYCTAVLQDHVPAQYRLGICYRDGVGVETNKLMAGCFFEIADNGHRLASNSLTRLRSKKVLRGVLLADVLLMM